MKTDNFKTEVQFRKDKLGVFAVFPYLIESLSTVMSYAHIGQHSAACWNINQFTKAAKPSEYKDLKKELENIGYNLKVIRRRSHAKYLRTYYSLQNK